MNIRGVEGKVVFGYQVAAKIGSWELTPKTDESMFFTGTWTEIDDYWMTQEPLSLALRVGRTQWEWASVTPVRDNQYIHITVIGKPVVEPV
jgi:hypothetical protein